MFLCKPRARESLQRSDVPEVQGTSEMRIAMRTRKERMEGRKEIMEREKE